MLHTRSKGNIGETVACEFITRRGYRIVERNYYKKWGEIDIVAEKDGVLNFFEVKSTTFMAEHSGSHMPEDNVHALKLRRLGRTISSYMAEQGRGPECEFIFHVLCVYLDMRERKGRVKWLKDIVL